MSQELARKPQELEVRQDIDALEEALRSEIAEGRIDQTIWDGGTDRGSEQTEHYFGDGIYARSLLIPAGTCVIGKVHKQARIVVVAQGDCEFVDEFHAQRVQAPWVGEFRAGSKTAVYAFEDTLWVACVATNSRDPKTAFDEVCVATHKEYESYVKKKVEETRCLLAQ